MNALTVLMLVAMFALPGFFTARDVFRDLARRNAELKDVLEVQKDKLRALHASRNELAARLWLADTQILAIRECIVGLYPSIATDPGDTVADVACSVMRAQHAALQSNDSDPETTLN